MYYFVCVGFNIIIVIAFVVVFIFENFSVYMFSRSCV